MGAGTGGISVGNVTLGKAVVFLVTFSMLD